MYYSNFVDLYEKLSKTTKRLEKISILSCFLKKLKKFPSEWIYLIKGRVLPDYDPREFGISDKLTIKAIAKSVGILEKKLIIRFRKIGDLGDIAKEFVGKRRQATLFYSRLKTEKVMTNLKRLVEIEGKGSVEKKLSLILELLNSSSEDEAKYIVRTLLNDLRIGVADGIIRDAIAKCIFPEEDMSEQIEKAYDLVNDYSLVFRSALKGKKELSKIKIIPGRPMKVMLPVKVTDIKDAFRICGTPAAIEHKYDGFRVIINKDRKNNIYLFTRRLENVTKQFPDVLEVVKNKIKGSSFILDTEVVGYNPKTKKYMPFEAISQRIKRKYDIERLKKVLPVEINVFDIMYYNGEIVIDKPFEKRRKIIEKIIPSIKFKIKPSTIFVTESEKNALNFYNKALKNGEEGIMVKNLSAFYHPGRRVGYMVKMKPDDMEFDLVVTGAEYGSGKRAGLLTSYFVACKFGDKFLEVGKVSSGLKEKEKESFTTYNEMTNILKPLILSEKGKIVKLKPLVVVSVTYQNIQRSPAYSSGFALRFPRIINYRPDRKSYDIATLDEIKKEIRTGNSLR